MITSYSIDEIIEYASTNSPFYRELYSGVSKPKLRNLPVLDQAPFWKALGDDKLLTANSRDGVVFKSGGTTGNPKHSYFNREEWESFCHIFGTGMSDNLREGDRVGNLFYAGELYASFVFIMKSLEYCPVPTIHYPITGAVAFDSLVSMVKENHINVLAGVPTSFMNLANHLKVTGQELKLDRILYGGEALYPDQENYLKEIFPGTQFHSIGYASVDGGHLGYCASDCARGEHRVFEQSIIEIIDPESGEVITEPGRKGKVIYSNLTRKLMPIIRYPVGDEAYWTSDGKFKLLGRSEEGARIGPVTVNRDDITGLLQKLGLEKEIGHFQLQIYRQNKKDTLKLRLGSRRSEAEALELCKDVIASFYNERPMFLTSINEGLINPLEAELVLPEQLFKNQRTGKLRFVIDNRHA